MVRVKRRGLINLDKRELLDQKWKPLSGRPFSMKQTVEVLIALMPVDLESPLMSFRPVPDTKAPFPERSVIAFHYRYNLLNDILNAGRDP